MSSMKCFGYYIVRSVTKPEYLKLDVSCLLSVGSDLSDTFPDLTKCFWINYPNSERIHYKERLQLTDDEFSDFCCLISELFNTGRMSPDVRFSRVEDALKVCEYLKNAEGYKILGLFTSSEIYEEFEKEGFFNVFRAGEESSIPCTFLGCDILGSENGGNGSFYFECYLVNSLNEEIAKHFDRQYMVDCETGLMINSFSEVIKFCECIQGMGEPVIWTPFEVYEYNKPW